MGASSGGGRLLIATVGGLLGIGATGALARLDTLLGIIVILAVPIVSPAILPRHELKVGAGDPRLVGEVHDEAPVPEEGADALLERGVGVVEGELEGVRVGLAVLAAQVADLAVLGGLGVAGGVLAADEGVEVGERLRAVAVLGDGGDVEVVRFDFALVLSSG